MLRRRAAFINALYLLDYFPPVESLAPLLPFGSRNIGLSHLPTSPEATNVPGIPSHQHTSGVYGTAAYFAEPLTSTPLTIAAYQATVGGLGAPLVGVASFLFGFSTAR